MKYFAAQRLFLLILFILSFTCFCYGQDNTAPRTTADENFTLSIKEERTTETNYERSTAVEVSGKENGLLVRVGASVRAQKIDIVLRGITGNVRFRASLETLIQRLLESGGVKSLSEP